MRPCVMAFQSSSYMDLYGCSMAQRGETHAKRLRLEVQGHVHHRCTLLCRCRQARVDGVKASHARENERNDDMS